MQPHCQISGQKSLTKSSEWLSQHVMTMLQWNFKFYHVMFLRSLKAGRKILQSSCDCCYSHITYFTTCLFSLVVACRKWMTVETRKESKSQKQEENSDTMPGMHGFRAPATGLRRLRPRRIGRIGRIGQVVLAHFSALRSIVADWKERSSRALVGSDDGSLSLWRLDSSECLARRGREKSRKITKNATLSKSVLPQDDSVRTCQETWKVAENLMLQLIGSLDTWALFGPSMLTGQQAQIWQNNRYIHNVVSDVILNYWCDVDVIWCDVKRRSAWLGILQYSTYHSLSENISTHIAKIPMCQTNPGPWKHETALNPDVFTVTSVTS